MPILYAPPEPVSPQISSGYGAAAQWTQDASILQRGTEAIAQAAQANAARQQQANAQAAQNALHQQQLNLQAQSLAQQGDIQRQQLGERARESDQSRDLQAAEFGANLQQQPLMQQQRAELQVWANGQELTQADVIRNQHMQNAVSAVMNDPSFDSDPEARDAALLQLRTGIDSFKQRMQKQQAAQVEQRTQDAAQQGHIMAALTSADETTRRQAMDQLSVKRVNPQTGQEEEFYFSPHTGKYEPFQFQKTTGSAAGVAGEKLEVKKQQMEMAAVLKGHLTADQYFKEYNAAAKEVDDRIKNGDDEAKKDRTAAVASALDARGIARSWPEHHQRQQKELQDMGILRPHGGEVAGQPQGEQVKPAAGVKVEDLHRTLGVYQSAAADFARMERLSPQEREQGARAAMQASELLASVGGDVPKMTREQRVLYQDARDLQVALARMGEQRKPRPQERRPEEGRMFVPGTGFTSKFQ